MTGAASPPGERQRASPARTAGRGNVVMRRYMGGEGRVRKSCASGRTGLLFSGISSGILVFRNYILVISTGEISLEKVVGMDAGE
jgi:hypothetical protein